MAVSIITAVSFQLFIDFFYRLVERSGNITNKFNSFELTDGEKREKN
jgi:hypothetical protein